MDRDDLSAAIIQEMGAVFMAALSAALPTVCGMDLGGMERHLRQMLRPVMGQVVVRVVAQEPTACPACGGRMRRVDPARPRSLSGLIGDYTLRRAYDGGHAPLDARLGLGPGILSPGLAQVVCRESLESAFEEAVDRVAEAVGVRVSAEVARQTTERIGAVAEAQVQAALAQAALAQAQRGQPPWDPAEQIDVPASGVLAVEVDGLYVHRDAGWHEMKVVTVAPLGPQCDVDAETGRGDRTPASALGRRQLRRGLRGGRGLLVPRLRGGLPARPGHGGGADRGAAGRRGGVDLASGPRLPSPAGGGPGGDHRPGPRLRVPVGRGHRRLGGRDTGSGGLGRAAQDALVSCMRRGRPRCRRRWTCWPRRWASHRRRVRGKVRRAREYLTANAARLDYPAFVARQLPIGSGAVESAGKTVIQARTKGAGMRWSGAQAVVSLRTLHRSGRWDAFWQRRPPAPLPAPPPHTSAAPARYGGPRPRFRPAAPYRATSGPATTSRARSRSTAPSDPAATPPVVLWPRSRSA